MMSLQKTGMTGMKDRYTRKRREKNDVCINMDAAVHYTNSGALPVR